MIWISGGLSAKGWDRQRDGMQPLPRELAPGEISEARVSCNLKEQSPWDQPGKSFTAPASPLRGAKALLNKLGIKE